MDVRVVGPGDPEYPPLLHEVPAAPARLFAAGRPLEHAPMVSIVGSRRASPYGVEVAEWLSAGLAAAGFTVVSGMAVGIDAAAHRGAMAGGGATVAVLGCGLDVPYPRSNAGLRASILERGTLLSEHPLGVAPVAHHFPVRNRIIAGMSLGTVVVEAFAPGGALITARLAAEMGREVFAVPGPVNAAGSRGAHALLRDGARLVTSAEDVVQDLGFAAPSLPVPPARDAAAPVDGCGPPAGLGPDERRVLALLDGHPLLLDAVAGVAGLPLSAAAAVLARLEIKGLATRHPGGRFARTVGTRPRE